MTSCIVVARYHEDCSWLLSLKDVYHICVQNKGDDDVPDSFVTKKLPNIGLDQYCYLDFIVTNYDDLPDMILFTQANIVQHLDVVETSTCSRNTNPILVGTTDPKVNNMSIDDIISLLFKQINIHGCTLNARMYKRNPEEYCVCPYLKVSPFYDDECDTGLKFGEWFERYVGGPMTRPESFAWFKNGIFGVKKEYVLSRPKQYYINIMQQIKGLRGELLHYIERSWFYMLNLEKPRPYSYAQTLQSYRHIFETLDNIVKASGQPFVEGSLFFFGNQDMSYNDVFLHKQINLYNHALKAHRIVEVGFNAGHSTALMLLANPTSKILHFDINEHAYTMQCYRYLKSVFGNERFIDFIEGDSRTTIKQYTDLQSFDLIHIDGGHTDIVAMSDIEYCKRLAAKENTVIIDDYNMDNIKKITNLFVRRGNIIDMPHDSHADYNGEMYHFIGRYCN